MNKEYLEDKASRERELAEKHIFKKIREGTWDKNESYPPSNRFYKIQEPVAKSVPLAEIWPILPLFGSTVVPIFPRPKTLFKESHGFDPSDIDRLVDFCKDTGKIQFVLGSSATTYEGLDYLNPIFEEIDPPNIFGLPPSELIDEKLLKEYSLEFDVIAEINFIQKLNSLYRIMGSPIEHVIKRINDYKLDFIILKSLGYDEIIEDIKISMVTDINRAFDLFNIYGNLVAVPQLQVFKAITNINNNVFRESTVVKDIDKMNVQYKYPLEIGKFLLKKLSLYPTSFEACKDVIGTYEQEDVYRLLNNLNEGILSNKFDVIEDSTENLDTVLDNIWNDAKQIKNIKDIVSVGIPISFTVMGFVAGGPIGGMGGILASFGYNVMEKYIEIKSDTISERIAKLVAPKFLCGVFDFKQQYSQTSRNLWR